MRKFILLLLILPTNIYATNITLDNAIYEVMKIGFMLPPNDLKWQDIYANANYQDIKAKIRKHLQDALNLNKKYPNITTSQKNNILSRHINLKSELENNIKQGNIKGAEITLYNLFMDLSLLAVNEYKGNISNFVNFDESFFYISLRCRLLISYILYNLNYMPNDQKIILEYTKMYIEKYKQYMQNDYKSKTTKYDYYNTYKLALNELLSAVNERYGLNNTLSISSIKDKNGNSLKGLWFSIDFDKALNPIYITYYSLFFGGYAGYHYYNFSSEYNFVETFLTNNGMRTTLLLYPKSAYTKNNIIYVTLVNDPINNHSIYDKPLYLQARFKDSNMFELSESYYDGITLYTNNIEKYHKPYSLNLERGYKIKTENILKNITYYIQNIDKKTSILYGGSFNINDKKYHIFFSYYDYSYGYNGLNNVWSNTVISFWEDKGNTAILTDYVYIDNGGVFDSCESEKNIISCTIKYSDEKDAYGMNTYKYILENDIFYLYSYTNKTGIKNTSSSCSYYSFDANNKAKIDKISLEYLKDLRNKSYNSKKCTKILGIE